MKLEKPPIFTLNMAYLQRIWNGDFNDFLEKTDEEYYYWDKLKYRKDAPFENPEENWTLLKTYRTSKYESIKFGKYKFNFFLSSYIAKNLHDFDLKLMGNLQENPISESDKSLFFQKSLFEEAVASSQMEGATTTTDVARAMLESGRNPRNESEQMIFNNLRAIRYITEFKNVALDFAMIIELHAIMTVKTEAEKHSGSFRKGEVFVTDHIDGETAHIPPDWEEVEDLMAALCEFLNDDNKFIHPIIKASIVHFMIGFIHPFKDGNGRTARALFYWFLLKKGYSLLENMSISKVILDSRTQYDKAFLQTEYDDNDLNYFITYSLKNIRTAFEKLIQYRDKKAQERDKANLIAYDLLNKGLNRRQADLLAYLYLKVKNKITLNDYAEKHKIVRQTASKDFSELIKIGILSENKATKPYTYSIKSRKLIEEFVNK